jgi:hypothetical protein
MARRVAAIGCLTLSVAFIFFHLSRWLIPNRSLTRVSGGCGCFGKLSTDPDKRIQLGRAEGHEVLSVEFYSAIFLCLASIVLLIIGGKSVPLLDRVSFIALLGFVLFFSFRVGSGRASRLKGRAAA